MSLHCATCGRGGMNDPTKMEMDDLRAALTAMTTERNAILKAANEHTGSCFAERDQLKTTIADLNAELARLRTAPPGIVLLDGAGSTLGSNTSIAPGRRYDTDRERANHDACRYQAEIAGLRAEIERLYAIEKAAQAWCGMQGDVSGAFEAILAGRGPKESK